MNPRHPFESKLLTALAVAVMATACGGSDGVLAPNHGRVRFVIGAETGITPLASVIATSGSDGSEPTHDDSSGPGSGDEPDHSGPGDGTTDHQAFPFIKAANVTFSSVLARNLDGVLENVVMDLPVTVDVITLETGRQVQLPDGELPAATYDQVVVVMTEVELVLHDDTEITITPPGGGWTAVVPLCPPIEVEESGTSTVSLTLDVRNAVIMLDGRFHFAPRFKHPFGCMDEIPIEPLPM